MHDACGSCCDSALLGLNALDVLIITEKALQQAILNDNPSLLNMLGRQVLMLKIIDSQAMKSIVENKHTANNNAIDDVELILSLQMELCDSLNFVLKKQNMKYRNLIGMPEKKLASIVSRIKKNCRNKIMKDEFFAQWPPWQEYQRYKNTPSFYSLPIEVVEDISECEICFTASD